MPEALYALAPVVWVAALIGTAVWVRNHPIFHR